MSKNDHEMPDLNMIIIKRGQPQEEHPHGGAWKVAFADFMTAMMAFFLVLWIVNSTNKETRSSVARYFNPIRISDTTPARKGLKDPKEADFDAASGEDKPKPKVESLAHPEGQTGPVSGNGAQGSSVTGAGSGVGVIDPVTARDPFIVLDEIAGRATGASAASGLAPSAEIDLLVDGPLAFRDPFAPPAPVVPSEARPPAIGEQRTSARSATRPVSQAQTLSQVPVAELRAEDNVPRLEVEEKGNAKAQMRDEKRAAGMQKAATEAANLREAIAQALRDAGLAQGPKLDVRAIDEGILISLTDDLDFGMFAVGSAEPQPRFVRAMERIGALLSAQSGTFVVRGHTDARPFRTRAYDNWRLSAARAQMASYMLMRGKLEEKRIERIEGHADRALRNIGDPLAAENRRIEILLRPPQ